MVLAEVSVIPLSGAEMRPRVDAALEVIKQSGLKYEVGALGTTLEGNLDEILAVVKRIHQAVMNGQCDRLITEVRIDERRGKTCTIAKEVAGYR